MRWILSIASLLLALWLFVLAFHSTHTTDNKTTPLLLSLFLLVYSVLNFRQRHQPVVWNKPADWIFALLGMTVALLVWYFRL